jgi:carboxypeptidase PM20D1
VRLEFVLDEGLVVTDGVIPGVGKPVAMIGVAEKGSIALDLSVKVEAGHSSMPPPSSGTGAVAVLGEAMRRLDDRQMPAQPRGVARDMFETLAPEMRGLNRIVLSNLWLFGPMVKAQLQRAATTNAMLRTTSALTMVRAGDAENVMPGQADGIVSFRVAPGDTVRSVLDHVQETIDDARVSIQARPGAAEASPVSATSSTGYSLINRSVREVLPDAVVVPGLLIGGTDARHFSAISDDVFRFSPIRTRPEDLSRFHGVNERISVENLVELVRFYHRFIDLAAGPAL